MGQTQGEQNQNCEGFQRARWPILLAAVGYAIAIVVWGLRQEGRIVMLESHHVEFDRRIDRIDERGSRQLPIVADKISNLENQINLARQLAINAIERSNQYGMPNRMQRLPYEDRW